MRSFKKEAKFVNFKNLSVGKLKAQESERAREREAGGGLVWREAHVSLFTNVSTCEEEMIMMG